YAEPGEVLTSSGTSRHCRHYISLTAVLEFGPTEILPPIGAISKHPSVSADPIAKPAAQTRAESRVLDLRKRLRERDRLSAGGRWIRTSGSAREEIEKSWCPVGVQLILYGFARPRDRWFADSPPEGDRLEPSLPLTRTHLSRGFGGPFLIAGSPGWG